MIYGAQGGLAGRSFAINQMLRAYEPTLDTTFDFHSLVLPVGSGQTLLRPPVISQAQMAFALGDSGQVARRDVVHLPDHARSAADVGTLRTGARISSVSGARPAGRPTPPLPRTDAEVAYWNKWVAEGWAQGEKQAVEIFLSDLDRLRRDMTGMARYRVLLRSGLVLEPRVAYEAHAFDGNRDNLHLGDRVIRITDQPGLNGRRSYGGYDYGCQ